MSEKADDDRPDYVRLYEEKVSNFERWSERKQEIKERSLGETKGTENLIAKRINNAIETEQMHDELLYYTITAFGPRSEIRHDTGWKLLAVEPLYEVDPELRNPDVLIGNDDYDFIVMVECKTGLSGPQNTLEQIREQAEVVLDHDDYLERKTGCDFDAVERVLCIPGTEGEAAVRAIEQEERENEPEEPIHLWKVHQWGDEELLQLHTNFATRTEIESAHNSELSRKLRNDNGVSLTNAPAITNDFFPDSHPFVIMDNVFADILDERADMDASIRKLTRSEVYDQINDQSRVPHYDIEDIAETLCENVLERMWELGLIEPTETELGMGDSVETFAYVDPPVSGQTSERIHSNLRNRYKTEWIERKAEHESIKQTVDEFRDIHLTLDDFVED